MLPALVRKAGGLPLESMVGHHARPPTAPAIDTRLALGNASRDSASEAPARPALPVPPTRV